MLFSINLQHRAVVFNLVFATPLGYVRSLLWKWTVLPTECMWRRTSTQNKFSWHKFFCEKNFHWKESFIFYSKKVQDDVFESYADMKMCYFCSNYFVRFLFDKKRGFFSYNQFHNDCIFDLVICSLQFASFGVLLVRPKRYCLFCVLLILSCIIFAKCNASATIRRTRRLPRTLGQRGRQKCNCVIQKVTNVHQEKGMNMMKVNEIHDYAVSEKTKVLHYFRFAAEGLIFFLFNFNFTYTRQAMPQLV